MKKMFLLLLSSGFILLTSCASIVSGRFQKVTVNTQPVQNAQCSLSNNKGTWFVKSTPSTIKVHRSFHNLTVQCERKDYGRGTSIIKSNTKVLTFGNAVLGGAIGAGVDMANGAAYDYPDKIQIQLKKKK